MIMKNILKIVTLINISYIYLLNFNIKKDVYEVNPIYWTLN